MTFTEHVMSFASVKRIAAGALSVGYAEGSA